MKRGDSAFREDIPLILDSYEDIFSDFDPRSFSQKALSEDFLHECKKASVDKKKVGVKFFVPAKKRSLKDETKIKKRLREHFKKHALRSKKEYSSVIRQGSVFTFLGISFMLLATFFFVRDFESYYITFLSILLEPGGWFLFWEGLDLIIFETKHKKPEKVFYKKMANSEISFSSYQ